MNNGTEDSFESWGRKLDELPQMQAAREALAAARAELAKAEQLWAELHAQVEAKTETVRDKNVGDLIAATLAQVSKRPAVGVCVTFALGWIAGRLFQRRD